MNANEALLLLNKAIAEESQAVVAKKLGYIDSYLSQIKTGKMKISEEFQTRLVEVYGNETVNCPVFGIGISLARCRNNRERESSMANPVRVELARVCPTCNRNVNEATGRGK